MALGLQIDCTLRCGTDAGDDVDAIKDPVLGRRAFRSKSRKQAKLLYRQDG